ncbi:MULTISPECIES: hypothetical protein [Sphingomonadaceae]|uniref:hypothetical protein n=1 Tax=Sphingomonadales TaxID=204457 RepID=UPI000770658F|nr:hypothetical protein [Sphingobium sp. TKS]AMK23165.1 hypothetical protein K426_11115 [Sphingobium sp. TKS]MCF8707599.1 hypothetical protein [Rhizorhapis sp. SPR117]
MSDRRSVSQTNWRVFRWPLLIGIMSFVGLLSALVGDGWYDALSWLCLGACVFLMVVAWRGWSAK